MSKTKVIKLFLFLFIVINSKAQTYNLEYFEAKYDTLVDYTSICNENALNGEIPFFFSQSFDFGFDFPFFDKSFNKVNLEDYSVGIFENSVQYNFYLFACPWHVYYWANQLDYEFGNPVNSDWRYKYDVINNKKVFIVEYRHVGPLVFDTKPKPYEGGDVNFQQWFWENGDVEVRFGDVLIDSTLFNGAIIDPFDSGLYALSLGIQNYENTIQIFVEGTIKNFKTVTFEEESSLDSLPRPNTGFRFRYLPLSTKELHQNDFRIQNPVTDRLYISTDIKTFSYELIDICGKSIAKGEDEREINVCSLIPGEYILSVKSNGIKYNKKFVKL
jgi:hypothetical protein